MTSLGAERRRSRRFELGLSVRITRLSDRHVDLAGRTLNVSSSGAYLTLDQTPVEEGDRIEFLMQLEGALLEHAPGPVMLRCRGRVVRADQGKRSDSSVRLAATIDRYQFQRD